MKPPKIKKDFFFGLSPDLPKIVEIALGEIHPNPDQPRKTFRDESLAELASSIERHGLIQPITVKREDDGTYLLVAGERRFRAFEKLEKSTIPAIVTTGNAEEIALIENIQREDLHPLEEAEALERMMERYHYTQEELGKVIGKAQNTVSETLQLNALPSKVKEEYRTSDNRLISKSALIELTRIKDTDRQHSIWDAMKQGKWTVRATRKAKSNPTLGIPAQDKTIGAGRLFLKKLQTIEQIDNVYYQELALLVTALSEQLQRLQPDKDE